MDNEWLERREGEDGASEDQILERLISFGATLMTSRSLEATLNTIVREVKATGYDRVRLYMLSPDRQFMICQAHAGMENGFAHHARPADSDPYLQKLLSEPQLHIFRRQEGHALPFEGADGPDEWVCIPLIIRGRVIGKLSVDNKTSGRPLLTERLKEVSLFALLAAAAIEAARRSRTIETFSKVAATVSSALDLEEIFRRACQEAKELFDASHSALVLFDEGYEFGHVVAEYPPDTGATGTRLPLKGVDVEERLIKSQEPIVLEDVAAELAPGELRDILLGFGIQSLLAVPVVSRDRLLGSFSLDAIDHKRRFTEEEIDLCRTLATQMAIAVEKVRRFQETEQQLTEVTEAKKHLELAMHAGRIIARVSTLGNSEDTLQLIAEGTPESLKCDAITLYAFDETSEKLDYPPKTKGLYYPEKTRRFSNVLEDSFVYDMLRCDEPYVVENTEQDEIFRNSRFTREERIKSLVAVPLIVAGRRTGVIFFNYRTEHRFTEEDLNNIRMFADLAAVAIHNAQLFAEKTARLNEQRVLAHLSQDFLKTTNWEETLKCVVEVVRSVFQTEYASIVLPGKDGELLTCATAGWEDGIAGVHKPGEDSHTGYTIICKKPVRVTDYSAETRFKVPPIVAEHGIKSGLSAPIIQANGVTGALLAQTTQPRKFTDEEEALLGLIASETSIALQRAQHYESLQEAKSVMVAQNTLVWMGMGNTQWKHDIHTKANTILTILKNMDNQSGVGKPIPKWMGGYLNGIRNEANEINEKLIVKPLSSEKGAEDVSVRSFLVSRRDILKGHRKYDVVKWISESEPSGDLVVRISFEWLRDTLDILIDNAVDAISDLEPARQVVSVFARAVENEVEIIVRDCGCGIPENVLKQLFKGKVENSTKSGGLGIGLLMAKAIAEFYGGSIRVGYTGPAGTEMIIRLPVVRQNTGELNDNA